MNQEKSAAYKKLVANMQTKYPVYTGQTSTSKVPLWAPIVDGENLCKEINLYTYWQGLGYAEKTPRIKYLLVAQDFGSCFGNNSRINAINAGNKNLPYFDTTNSFTDNNLVKLFKILGYDDIMTRHEELFFTNFCLGYRSGNNSGGMTKKMMMNDAAEFKSLCDILEPENILCLGKITSECAYEAFSDKGTWRKIYSGFKSYNDFIENHAELTVNCGKSTARFFPLVHCGYMGTMNRNRNLTKQNDLLYYQKQDWKKIYEVNI